MIAPWPHGGNDFDNNGLERLAWRRMSERFAELAGRINPEGRRARRHATRLWNWADHQPEAEELLNMLAVICSFAFDDIRDPNTIHFSY
jgi:hypothetical protein